MNAFHRQLTCSFLLNFLRTLFALLVILWAFMGFTLGGDSPLSFFTVLIGEALPLALMVAALFTVGGAARRHELMVLQAAGWPLHRIVGPLLVMGLVAIPVAAALGAARDSPMAGFLALIMGVVLGATRRERTMFSGFMLAAIILAGYYVVSATAQALGRHDVIPPILAEWSPLVLLSGLAWMLWRRAAH